MSHPVTLYHTRRYENRADGSWSRCAPSEATHVVVEFKDGPYTPHVQFEMPKDPEARRMAEHWADQVERLMQLAYDRGDAGARKDIRRALGVTDPRP